MPHHPIRPTTRSTIPPRRPARGLAVALAASLAAFAAQPAHAASELLWDFNDFPTAAQGLAVGAGIYPTDYGCSGAATCTGFDVYFLAVGNGVNGSVSKTLSGVTGTFSRPNWQAPGSHDGYNLLSIGGALNWGNTVPGDAHAFLADFSGAFTAASVDLGAPYDLGGALGSYGTFLDMWSGPGGTGTLLARAEVLPGQPYAGTLSLEAPAGTTALSLTFGNFLVGSPGCVYEPYGSGLSMPCLYAIQGNADNVRITPVPETGPALLLGAGLAAIAAARGRKRGDRCGS